MVVLRLVPDTGEEFELAADGRGIDREWIGLKLNEFDDHALEEAVLLKESVGAKVTAVALEGDGIDRLLQTAIARGADQVAKIAYQGEPPVQAATAAEFLAVAARQLGCDLILTGVQTAEDLFGQLAPSLAAVLDWPQMSAVSGVTVSGGNVVAQQEYSGGFAAAHSIALPAVIGVQAASKPPRYVSGSKLREAAGTKIGVIEPGVSPGPATAEIMSVAFPVSQGRAEMLEGKAEAVAERLAALLRERGFVRGSEV
jgi:electron transfer flavoprotein beta subunit